MFYTGRTAAAKVNEKSRFTTLCLFDFRSFAMLGIFDARQILEFPALGVTPSTRPRRQAAG